MVGRGALITQRPAGASSRTTDPSGQGFRLEATASHTWAESAALRKRRAVCTQPGGPQQAAPHVQSSVMARRSSAYVNRRSIKMNAAHPAADQLPRRWVHLLLFSGGVEQLAPSLGVLSESHFNFNDVITDSPARRKKKRKKKKELPSLSGGGSALTGGEAPRPPQSGPSRARRAARRGA